MYINNDVNYLRYLKGREVIIFGAGVKGKRGLYQLNRVEDIRITAFCDNDEKKQNNLFCGFKVISIDYLYEINHNDLIIVICSNYEAEIRQQLLNKGIYNFISISQVDLGGLERLGMMNYILYISKSLENSEVKSTQRYFSHI